MKQFDSFFRSMLPRIPGILLACLLLFASCGGDDSSDDSYAAVESASFTFDETESANNAVRVMANGAWQVYWEPASVGRDGRPFVRQRQRDLLCERHAQGDVRQSRGAHRCGQGFRAKPLP